MTRGDIEVQGCNPDFVRDQCLAVLREMERDVFSLGYIRGHVRSLSVFVEGLRDTDRDG